eukprot:8053205-Pyramimonas_sp.AAC.1
MFERQNFYSNGRIMVLALPGYGCIIAVPCSVVDSLTDLFNDMPAPETLLHETNSDLTPM